MDDITDLMRAVKMWGWYEAMLDYKASGCKRADAGLGEILEYEFEVEKDGAYTMTKTEDKPKKVGAT
jgi:hypothetical protein